VAFDLSIDRDTGSLLIGFNIRFGVADRRPGVTELVAPLIHHVRDLGNGYVWVNIRGLTFGEHACAASICFSADRVHQFSWSAWLPDAEADGGWPMREAIDDEIKYVRGVLSEQLDRDFKRGEEVFPWGCAWSRFDPKGIQASNGLRYASRWGAAPARLTGWLRRLGAVRKASRP
jgi:hypothetical protein